MRVQAGKDYVKLWLSKNDTYNWAHEPNKRWPCSTLSGHRLFAEFDRDGLLDMSIDSGRGDQDCDGNEFNAITSDFLRDRLSKDHPCYGVAVGQFQ